MLHWYLICCSTGDVTTRYQKDVGSVTDVTLICCSTGDVTTRYQKAFMHRALAEEFSFDMKPVNPLQFSFFRKLEPSAPRKLFWAKLKGTIGELDAHVGVWFTYLILATYFPSVLCHFWLANRKGIWPVKSWVLLCWWWWFDWNFARLVAPVVNAHHLRHP